VSIYAASKERSLEDIRTSLSEVIRNFEADPPGNRKLIRDLLDNDRGLFYTSALEILKSSPDSRGVQYLVALLVANGMLLEALCDPALDRDQAMTLGRAAVRVDPMADAGLARGLADSETGQGSVLVRDAPRLMEILCEVGDPGRMMASMLRLLRHPNPYLRSKAVKVVGRGSKSPKWVRQRLNEADPRIRANAIEALWSVDTAEARLLLQFAAADGNNRVAANALLGLYYLGECSALVELVKMAANESPLFRSSAAWAMGETGDFRFTDMLRRMLNDPDQTVRKRVFTALARIRQRTAQFASGCDWRVSAKLLPPDSQNGARRVLIGVAGDDARELPAIPPLGFILSEGGSYITSYRVSERPVPEAMSVVFLIPRRREASSALYTAVESCIRWKRTSDLWCILPYMETGDGEPASDADPGPPVFTSSSEALRKMISEPAKRIDCTGLWPTMWSATKLDSGSSRGKRHVIILSSAQEARIAGHGLIANLQSGRVSLQAIARAPNTRLQELCHSVNAPFRVCAEDDAGESIRQAYLMLLARYEVTYQPIGTDATSLKVRVQAPGGSGETEAVRPDQAE
jgi:HEAT repeats